MESNLHVLTAQKGQRERRRLTLRKVAAETGLSPYTVYAMANNELEHYPRATLEALCAYFGCELSDLLALEPAQDRAA